MAITINPESSSLRSGIESIRIEKMRGKMFPKASPARKIETSTTARAGTNIPAIPIAPSRAVSRKKRFGERKLSTIEPSRRPIARAVRKKPIPRVAIDSMSNPKRSWSMVAIQEFSPTSAPT